MEPNEEIAELKRQLAAKDRQIIELRDAIEALLAPAPSEYITTQITKQGKVE